MDLLRRTSGFAALYTHQSPSQVGIDANCPRPKGAWNHAEPIGKGEDEQFARVEPLTVFGFT
jgi:hypothetical protein